MTFAAACRSLLALSALVVACQPTPSVRESPVARAPVVAPSAVALAPADRSAHSAATVGASAEPAPPSTTVELRPDELNSKCQWMDLGHPDFKDVRATARKLLEVPEATDRQPQITCCRVTTDDALCKVWKSAQLVAGAPAGIHLVGLRKGADTPWLNQWLTVSSHYGFPNHNTPLLKLNLRLTEAAVVLERVSGICPVHCKSCTPAQAAAKEACEGVGSYVCSAGNWRHEAPPRAAIALQDSGLLPPAPPGDPRARNGHLGGPCGPDVPCSTGLVCVVPPGPAYMPGICEPSAR